MGSPREPDKLARMTSVKVVIGKVTFDGDDALDCPYLGWVRVVPDDGYVDVPTSAIVKLRNPPDEDAPPLWPTLGSEWIWEAENPSARCRVRVERISKVKGDGWVHARVITRDVVNLSPVGSLWGNELDRWHEAVTAAPLSDEPWEIPVRQ